MKIGAKIGQNHCLIETEVKFEDGRRGKIEADVKIWEAKRFPSGGKAA